MRLHKGEERDRELREHVETVHYLDAAGELYAPTEPQETADAHDDDDEGNAGSEVVE